MGRFKVVSRAGVGMESSIEEVGEGYELGISSLLD